MISEAEKKRRENLRASVLKHGHCAFGKRTKEWRCWANMRARCNDPADAYYHNYGGRGIKVCERWMNSYPIFLEDMGYAPTLKHTLDRVNNDGNYEPGNCRWATRSEQMRNTRRSHYIEFNGETKTLVEWQDKTGINYFTILYRLKSGWSMDRALTQKSQKSCK